MLWRSELLSKKIFFRSSSMESTENTVFVAGVKAGKQVDRYTNQKLANPHMPFKDIKYDGIISFKNLEFFSIPHDYTPENIHVIEGIEDEEKEFTEEQVNKLITALQFAEGKRNILVLCNGGNNRSRLLACLIRLERDQYIPSGITDPVQDYYKNIVDKAAELILEQENKTKRENIKSALTTVKITRKRRRGL